MKRALMLSVFFLSGCSVETTVLLGPRRVGGDTQLVLDLSIERRLKGRRVCAYRHESQVNAGWPVNGDDEVHTDFGGCGWRFGEGAQ